MGTETPGSASVAKEGQIPQQVEQLAQEATNILSEMQRFDMRIRPVLNRTDEKDKVLESTPTAPMAPHAYVLSEIRETIGNCRRLLISWHDELEV